MPLYSNLKNYISLIHDNSISNERREILHHLVDYVQDKKSKNQKIRLNFICTHNSRRSHLAQIWAQTLAYHFGIDNVFCYSGGTKATALFPVVAETLHITGFELKKLSEGNNPVYSIKYSKNEHAVIGFSKQLDDDFNPKSDFCAIMTCDSADEACPVVPGAEKRITITYQDPKEFDNTLQQADKYMERSLQIASEMYYVFSKIKLLSSG